MQLVPNPLSQAIQFVPAYSFMGQPAINLSLNFGHVESRFTSKKNKFIRRINLKTSKISGTR
jgi:hypothetical protein